jgi:hypothetical protein
MRRKLPDKEAWQCRRWGSGFVRCLDDGAEKFPNVSGPLDSVILGAGDLLDKIDDGSPKLCVRNLHEGFGEVEPVGRGEIV